MTITGHATGSMFRRYSITSETQKENALRDVTEFHRVEDERRPEGARLVQ